MKRISLYLISCTAILALLLMSCSVNGTSKLETHTPAVQPTVSVPKIELVPYTSDSAAMETLVPKGWTEVRRGVSVQFKPPGELPLLGLDFYAHAPQGWLRYWVTREFGLLELPPS